MNNIKHIVSLAQRKMTIEGYTFFSRLIKHLIYKYNWSISILDEKTNKDRKWGDDEILTFTQQFLTYVLDKNKLDNYKKIPDNYLEYYFQTLIVTYVAKKIKEYQKKIGISYDDVKRIAIPILNDQYFKLELQQKILWNSVDSFNNPIIQVNSIESEIGQIPKIPITEKTKHYKPLVNTAINDIFELIKCPIEQDILLNQIFKLFDQSNFFELIEDEEQYEIRHEEIITAVDLISKKIQNKDITLILEYFFNDSKLSLNEIAKNHNLPKSTVHHRTKLFTQTITNLFSPNNETEGVYFLELLHKKLDELK